MEKITFQIPQGANLNDLEKIANNNKLSLEPSTKKGSGGTQWVDVFFEGLNSMGSLASLISLFLSIKKSFGRREVIIIEIPINGEIEEQELDYFINYLTDLKNKKNDSTNQ